MEQIERSKTNELWRLIYGLGIRHIGERAAQVLARAFGSIDALASASVERLQATPEIGPVLARSLRSWFDEPRNLQLVERLRAAGVRMAVPADELAMLERPGPLTGRTYVLTGTLDSMSREAATAALERLGAQTWVDKARAELGSIGGRTREEGLTAAERRVAELAAQGRTNREVAAALFLSERTVESHLTRVYAKLGVRSRTELSRSLR